MGIDDEEDTGICIDSVSGGMWRFGCELATVLGMVGPVCMLSTELLGDVKSGIPYNVERRRK